MRATTPFQTDVLFVVSQNSPASVADVARHLHVDDGAARSRLTTLERRGLIARHYTGHHRGSQFAYLTTDAGDAALADLDEQSAPGVDQCDLCSGTLTAHTKRCMFHPDKVAARQRARAQSTDQEAGR